MSQMQQQSQTRQSSRAQQPAGRMYPTQNYLDQNTREAVVEVLNQMLADTADLHSQAKFAHWNVKGPNFFQLHELFDELAEILQAHADTIAERATALGGQAMGTVRMAATNSRVPEMPAGAVTGPECLELLADRLAIYDANLYQAMQTTEQYGDLDTTDLINEVSREVSKFLYFIESHLQTQPTTGSTRGEARQSSGASKLTNAINAQ